MSAETPSPAPSRVRVAFAGSSSVSPASPLPRALAGELGMRADEWVSLGVVSSRLADWTSPPWPAGLVADAVIVLLTGNDARPSADKVAAVDRALRRHASTVVWLPPLPYPADSRVAGREGAMRTALATAGVAHVATAVQLEPSHWSRDRAHLTRAGYEAYARQVAPALRAVLGLPQSGTPSTPAAAPPPAPAPAPPPTRTPAAPVPVPSPLAAPGSRLGTLITPRGAHLPLTSLDALWMGRALAGEGGSESDAWAITSSMLRRWAMLWDQGNRAFRSFTDLIVGRFRGPTPYDGDRGEVALRGYSQPVAVQWRTEGTVRAERRRRIRGLAWEAIEPWRRDVVLRLFTGRAALTAPGAVHFAVRSLVEENMRRYRDWQIVGVPGAAGVFVSTLASRLMREPRVVGADQPMPASPLEQVRDGVREGIERAARSPGPLVAIGAAALVAIAGVVLVARGRSSSAEPVAQRASAGGAA